MPDEWRMTIPDDLLVAKMLPEVQQLLNQLLRDDAWNDEYDADHRLLKVVTALASEVAALKSALKELQK